MTTKTVDDPIRAYIDQAGDLPASVLLGRIVLCQISDTGVPTGTVHQVIDQFGLDSIPKPAPNKYLDAFKKATSDVRDTYPLPKNRVAQLLCREVTKNTDFTRRQITREVRDAGRKRLSYDAAIEVTFHKPVDPSNQNSARLAIKVNNHLLEPGETPAVQAVAKEIEANYLHYYRTYDGMKIRGWVRSYLRKLNAVEIKGGVYFVPVSRDQELGRLAEFVSHMGAGCYMQTIPMVDLVDQRKFIADVFEREASQDLREITREVDDLLGSRKSITASAYAKIKARYDEVMGNAQEHMDGLQITQDLTAASAEVAYESLQKLVNAMLEE